MSQKKIKLLGEMPDELQLKIFDYAVKCKKDQCYYINKQLTELLHKKFEKCRGYEMSNTIVCKNCNHHAFIFIQYLGCNFI